MGRIPQGDLARSNEEVHKEEGAQKDHENTRRSRSNVQAGQDQVKLSLIDAEPDHDDKVPETSQGDYCQRHS